LTLKAGKMSKDFHRWCLAASAMTCFFSPGRERIAS
jgi:hypothetical protein